MSGAALCIQQTDTYKQNYLTSKQRWTCTTLLNHIEDKIEEKTILDNGQSDSGKDYLHSYACIKVKYFKISSVIIFAYWPWLAPRLHIVRDQPIMSA